MGIKFSQLPIASSVASDDYIAVLDTSESVLKRTPISHASQGSQYGLGTTQAYGHTKIRDNLTQTALTNGEALSSRQGNVIANDMGVVELSTTATHAHNVGDYFMLIGQFVKCTAKINVGNTINIGTNVVTTNIGEVLSQLNSNYSSMNSKIGTSTIPSALGTTITGALANIPFPFGIDSQGNYGYRKAGADTVTPFKSGGLSRTKLWENSNPDANFADSTVTLSQSIANFDYIEIEWESGWAASVTHYEPSVIIRLADFRETANEDNRPAISMLYRHTGTFHCRRAHYVSDTQVRFTNAYRLGTTGTAGTIAIPLKIYGLK